MSFLESLRVVRGPDWKWGDQDGGQGYAGTVIHTPESEIKEFGLRTVTVVWDSGIKSQYRAGPKGAHDLRIVSNMSLGVTHPLLFCDECRPIRQIRGTLWKCNDCDVALCTRCFLKETPHDENHNRFKRFDSNTNYRPDRATNVISWTDGRPYSRIQLMGFYQGAKVIQGPELTQDERGYENVGVVIHDIDSELLGETCVLWGPHKFERTYKRGDWDLVVIEPGIGGFYLPEALEVLDIPSDGNSDNPVSSIRALHSACKVGKQDVVRSLLEEAGVNIEEENERGFRPIHYAVKGCEPKILELLIAKGVHLDSLSTTGKSALHVAVVNQFTECARLLVQHGCDVNIQDLEGDTPLHDVIHGVRSIEIMRILASSGRIDWKRRNKNGFNVLHLAVLKHNHKAIQFILKEGDRDLVLERIGSSRSTILHYACFNQNIKLAKLILDHQKALLRAPNLLLCKLLEARTKSYKTALLISVKLRDYPMIELLVKFGADLKVVDGDSKTALMTAAANPNSFKLPPKRLCPPIYEDEAIAKKMKEDPTLGFLCYLIYKGCDLKESTLKSGSYRSKFLGHDFNMSQSKIDLLEGFSEKCRERGPCPARGAILPYPDPVEDKFFEKFYDENWDEGEDPEEDTLALDEFVITKDLNGYWNPNCDGNQNNVALSDFALDCTPKVKKSTSLGFVLDQFGNKYSFDSHRRASMYPGSFNTYRCVKEGTWTKQKRCGAVVERHVHNDDSLISMKLKTPHNHRLQIPEDEEENFAVKRKRSDDEEEEVRNVKPRN